MHTQNPHAEIYENVDPYKPVIPFLDIHLKEIYVQCKDLYTNVHSSFICGGLKTENNPNVH